MDVAYAAALRIYKLADGVVDFLSSALDVSNYTINYKKCDVSDNTLESYKEYMKLRTHIATLVDKLESIYLDPANHSDTFILSYKSLFNKFKIKYLQFSKEEELIKPDIVKKVGDAVFSEIEIHNSKLDKIVALREQYYKTPEIIHVYAYVMQRAINTFFTADKGLVFTLMEFIAEDKTNALRGTYKSDLKTISKDIVRKNPPQSRFGLIPQTDNMQLKELLKIILVEDNIAVNTTDLDKLSKKHKIGFIVFTSVVNTPVDYNVKPLINADEAKKYIQPDEYGITKKIIERFRTLNTYGSGQTWAFNIVIHNKQADKFYIVETLDGETYRCLAPWLYSTKYAVAKFRVKKILDYDATKPSRALEYNALAIKQSLPNMFTSKILALEEFDAKLEVVQSGTMQHKIVDKVLETANKLISKAKFKSPNDVSDLLHDEAIVKSFVLAVEQEFANDTNSFDGGAFPRCELMSSFITSLQTNTRRFAREVHNGYSRNPLKDADFDKSSKEGNKQVAVDKITEVLKNAVELVIKLDDNLFTSSYYKYLLLNYDM